MAALYPSTPNACGLSYVDLALAPSFCPEDDINVEQTLEVNTSPTVPESIPDIVTKVDTVDELLSKMEGINPEEMGALETYTGGQNCNDDWKSQRLVRITFSVSHRVMTKVRSLKRTLETLTAPRYLVHCILIILEVKY